MNLYIFKFVFETKDLFELNLFLLKLKIETENTVAK